MAYQGLKIIDFHVNFIISRPINQDKPEHIKQYQSQLNERFLKEWDFPPAKREVETEEELADRWLQEMDQYGVERMVFVHKLCSNETLAEVVKKYPNKFSGFVNHDPALPDAFEQLKYGVEELGLVGYKMVGPKMNIAFDDPHLEPIWKYLAERQIPVMIHFGPYGTGGGLVIDHPMINPMRIYQVARKYPDIPFVIAHFGCGYWGELIQLCWACPNVYIDTSGSNQWIRWMPYPLTLEDLFRKAYELFGPKRIIFGTDSRDFPRGFTLRFLQDQLRICRGLNMREEDLQDIFGGNAAQLLKMELYSTE
jgi:predicted TIM-barrel fold metal-dependent hydrolase